MEALEETDQYSNTIIVFLSDNGGRRVDTDKPEQGKDYSDLHSKTVLYVEEGFIKILFCIAVSEEGPFLTKID